MSKQIYMRGPQGKTKALTFSYDDALEQDCRLIELLDAHHMKGTFNINSGLYSPEDKEWPAGQVHRRMPQSQCATVYKNHEVAVHTVTHPRLEELAEEQCRAEVLNDRADLERMTGGLVRGMAYPFGTYSDRVVEVLRECGIAYARTTEQTLDFDIPEDWLRLPATCRHADPHLMELARRFVSEAVTDRDMRLFYVWGHTSEFDSNDNWDVIERFMDLMADRADIWYATNIDIVDYVQAYRQLIFSAEQTYCYNPTSTELWFAADDKVYHVAPGETVTL